MPTITFDQIMSIITLAAPPISAIIGIIVAVVKARKDNKATADEVIAKMEEVRAEIFNTKEYSELKTQLAIVHQENLVLKRRLNELLTKIDKIQRPEEDYENS